MISIIIPTLNEANTVSAAIENIKVSIHTDNYEIIIADGGSSDDTKSVAEPVCNKYVTSSAGRGVQLNNGAKHASGEVLLFMHADTLLPTQFDKMIANALAMNPEQQWGRFNLKLSGNNYIFRWLEKLINLRSRITSVSTGDQCLFITHELFDAVNGYQPIPLMEDVELSKRLKKHSAPICIADPVVTSSRRWENNGIVRTILLMWWLRLLFFLGMNPGYLQRWYK